MISTRYAPAVIALLTAALIPTVIHSYVDRPHDDGLATEAIPMMLAGQMGAPSGRDAQWGQRRLDAYDWFERRYGGPIDARLFVGRSYDAKQLYHHPEIEIAYGNSFGRGRVERFAARPEMPVHVIDGVDANARAVAMYVLLYDGHFVENPVTFQLRTSLELLFSRRKPMTIFFVRQQRQGNEALDASLGGQLLVEAIDAFQRQQPARRD